MSDVPQWIQIGGVLVGVPVALVVAWYAWRHRRELWVKWLALPAVLKFAIVGGGGVVALVGGGAGLYGYNYMMHDNDFCQSCHIMDTAWNRFQTTTHKGLQCHACHRQPFYAGTIELYWWVVHRQMAVPPHDKVPTAVCSECHMREGTDSTKTLVTLTAGHALHLKSDSSSLAKVTCVSCHGRDFHAFVPTKASCAQSGCHMNLPVTLGVMSSQSFQHCTTCHDFKGKVPPGTTPAQARIALAPKTPDCLGCHKMTETIRKFDLDADPHKGNCGSCHNAHKQKEPKDAFKTCATAQCHASADTLTAFHRGLGKGHALDQCGACHQAHSWKVKGTDCLACHKTINQDRPPKAARRVSTAENRGVFLNVRFVRSPSPPPVQQSVDTTFRHSIHKALTCTDCHGTGSTHGGLKFARPAGCMGCHHGPQQREPCATCHKTAPTGSYAVPVTFAITARRDPVTRPLTFTHSRHNSVSCARCHSSDTKKSVTPTCTSCHSDHHVAQANCASCHPTARVGHDRGVHAGCAGCHTDTRLAALPTSRALCVSCHQEQSNHYPTRDCGACHALDPNAMLRGGRAGAGTGSGHSR